jgi:hypothetical protein
MKRLVVQVMLAGITVATSVNAQTLEPFAGLGRDRSTLSLEQVRARSQRFQESTSFSLLRFPEARRAPARIFSAPVWSAVQTSARAYDLDPMLLAGMIFIESYGDPLAKSPTGPAGIAQLTKGSARELGLSTHRKIKIGTRAVKKTRYIGKGKNRRRIVETRQEPLYKTVDERLVPERAIDAMARRLSARRTWLGGKVDFAVAEYHMGAGRMAKLLSAYFGRTVKISDVTRQMLDSQVSYAELFWTNTPYFRPEVYQALEELNDVDYSPTYYFRVQQAMRLLGIYRAAPAEYARLASAYQGRLGQTVLPNWQWTFLSDSNAPAPAVKTVGEPQPDLGERFALLPEVASKFGVRGRLTGSAAAEMMAERSTIGSALFLAHQLRKLQGDQYRGFEITTMMTPDGDEDAALPMHRLGWAFDVPARPLSKSEERDLRFILTDMRYAGLLAYVEEDSDTTYHVVRHPEYAAKFEQFYWDAMAGVIPDRPTGVVASAEGR